MYRSWWFWPELIFTVWLQSGNFANSVIPSRLTVGILGQGRALPSFYLCTCRRKYKLLGSYSVQGVLIYYHPCFVWCSDCPSLAPGSLLTLASPSFGCTPNKYSLNTCSYLGSTKCPQAFVSIPILSPQISHLLDLPGSSKWEMISQNQDLSKN